MDPYRVLGKLKWTGQLTKAEIIIRHRGAPDNKKVIAGDAIIDIKRDRFLCVDKGETAIPMHRVVEIKFEGKIVWSKK